MSTALMTVIIINKNNPGGTVVRNTYEMPTDLSAENLGESLALAINEAWKNGVDPVDMITSVVFR
jgi:hypothetical protein